MIIIRTDINMVFDSETFNELHLYVEDYCARVLKLGKKVLTLHLLPNTKIEHHSITWHQLGPCWGNYNYYKQIFSQKHPGIATT